MDGFALTGIFLFVLFLLLGSGVWVALALLGVGVVGMELFTARPAGDAMITTIWRSSSSWTLTASAALHLDGRDPVPDPPERGHVQGPCTLDGQLAWPAAAHQRRRLHGLCRGLGQLGRDHDHGRQDVDPGASPARLSRALDHRLARRCRDARPDDPAIPDPHRLRRDDQRIDQQAVHRRGLSRAHRGGPLHGLCRALVDHQCRQDPGQRRGPPAPCREDPAKRRAPADPGADHRRSGRHLYRPRHRDRGRELRRRGCPRARLAPGLAQSR